MALTVAGQWRRSAGKERSLASRPAGKGNRLGAMRRLLSWILGLWGLQMDCGTVILAASFWIGLLMEFSSRRRLQALLVLVFFGVIWFWGLGHRPLFATDEGRYAEIPREMLVSGNWVTPRLDGFRYFEKPPLQYWGIALGYRIFGVHDWVARLYPALASFLTIILIGYASSRLFRPQVGWTAGAILAGSFYFGFLGHFNTLDAGLCFAMSLALFGFLMGIRAPPGSRQERNWMWASFAGLALSVLSKGLIGILLPGAVLVLFMLVRRDWRVLGRMHLLSGVGLFLAMVLPWFVAVSMENHDFLWQFFMVQEFLRYFTRVSHRPGPWWYFLPLLLIAILPWIGAAIRAIWAPLAAPFRRYVGRPEGNTVLVLWIWSAFIVLFFSASHSKLPSYILPVIPAVAVLLACALDRDGPLSYLPTAVTVVVALVLIAAAAFGSPMYAGKPVAAFLPGLLPWLYGAGGALIAAAVVAIALRSRRTMALVVLAGGWMIGARLIMLGAGALGPLYSTRALVSAAARYNRPGVQVYSIGGYQQTLPFYLGRKMTLVSYLGELQFGIDQRRHLDEGRYIPTLSEFAQVWAKEKPGQALGFAPRPVLGKLKALKVNYRIVASNPRWVALVPQNTTQ